MYINPEEDGVTHINIYSQARTELGRMLSNFYHYGFDCVDGHFESVEGYWYWLSLPPQSNRDILRSLYGYKAKECGKALIQQYGTYYVTDFQTRIMLAVALKMTAYKHLITPEYIALPWVHYYNYGGKVIDASANCMWWLESIIRLRSVV